MIDQAPMRGDWDSFVLFEVTWAVALALIGWIIRVALHRRVSDHADRPSR